MTRFLIAKRREYVDMGLQLLQILDLCPDLRLIGGSNRRAVVESDLNFDQVKELFDDTFIVENEIHYSLPGVNPEPKW